MSCTCKPKTDLELATNELRSFIAENNLVKYSRIPKNQLYKLFIDANRWQDADRTGFGAKLFDVREPNYMCAMMRAFMWGMANRHKGLSANFIEELHDRSVDGVTSYGRELEKGFRKKRVGHDSEAFDLKLGETVSEQGYKELVAKRKDPRYIVHYEADNADANSNLFQTFMLHPERTIHHWRKEVSVLKRKDPSPSPSSIERFQDADFEVDGLGLLLSDGLTDYDGNSESLMSLHSDSPVHLEQESDRTFRPVDSPLPRPLSATSLQSQNSLSWITTNLDNLSCSTTSSSASAADSPVLQLAPLKPVRQRSDPRSAIVLREPRVDDHLKKAVEHLTQLFNKADKSTQAKKRDEALLCMQDLDQLHAHYDGNIRTDVILLSHILHADDRETPPCFDDPNCFDGLSQEELREKYKAAQNNFRSLEQSSSNHCAIL